MSNLNMTSCCSVLGRMEGKLLMELVSPMGDSVVLIRQPSIALVSLEMSSLDPKINNTAFSIRENTEMHVGEPTQTNLKECGI